MSEIEAEHALRILKNLRDQGEAALGQVPMQEDLPTTLTKLSDIVFPHQARLRVIREECVQAERAKFFAREALPPKEIGQYALHLTHCEICRCAVGNQGILPFQRSTELLRVTLEAVTPKA